MNTMTQYEYQEILKKLINKTQGKEKFFDYSPSDVMFWENVRMMIEEYPLLKKEIAEAENYIIAKGI